MKGRLEEETGNNDNLRAKKYIAKTTLNCAITHGVSEYLGSLEEGKYADIVMYNITFFPAKPKSVFNGGFIVWSIMGDPNASAKYLVSFSSYPNIEELLSGKVTKSIGGENKGFGTMVCDSNSDNYSNCSIRFKY
jgi:urease alpha subunit